MKRAVIRSILTALLLFAPQWVQAATPGVPETGILNFVVRRNGDVIGHHIMRFAEPAPGHVALDVQTDIAVKMLFVTVYSFAHTGHEEWKAGRLWQLDTQTNDDGTAHRLKVDARDSGLNIAADGRALTLPVAPYTGSLWNPGSVSAPVLLNTLDGNLMAIRANNLGQEIVTGPRGPAQAQHWHIDGDLKRDVWYDGQGVMVKLSFAAKDGSTVVYTLD